MTGGDAMEPKYMSAEDLYREEVLEAREVPPHRRIALGLELYEFARKITIAGIRNQFPDADEAAILQKLRERIAIAKTLESRS
jgi:hypothetical protein